MKKLPIYGFFVIGYIVLISGVIKFMQLIEPIKTVTLETQQTAIKFGPLIFISIFVFIILSGTGVWLTSTLWKYFIAHKTMFVLPFLLISIGFIQLVITGLTSMNTLIRSNSEQIILNNEVYIKALMSLSTYTIISLCLMVGSVVYSIMLNRGYIFSEET